MRFSDFGIMRISDFFVASLLRGFRGLLVERVKNERMINFNHDDDIAFRLLLIRVPAAFLVLVITSGVLSVIAALALNFSPVLSYLSFICLVFFSSLKFSQFVVAVSEILISWALLTLRLRFDGGSRKYFYDMYGRMRFPLVFVSLCLTAWGISSGEIADIVYG